MNRQPSPPLFLLRLFRWFCDPRIVEDIEGDLVERFEKRVKNKGHKKAKRLFIKDVFRLFRPGIIRSVAGSQKLNPFGMLKNNIKVARRQLMRNKMYSSIKIGGFSIGIAVCLLIALFIRDELNYDQHIGNRDNLFMVVNEYNNNGDIEKFTWFPPPFSEAIGNDFPEVLYSGRMLFNDYFGAGSASIRRDGQVVNIFDDGFAFADQSILDMFGYEMTNGDAKQALSQPRTLVMTQSRADLLFPESNPIGQIVYVNDDTEKPYTVTGVLADLPANSTIKFDYLLSLKEQEFLVRSQNSWGSNNYQVFVQLQNPGLEEQLAPKLDAIKTNYWLPSLKKAGYADAEEIAKSYHYSLLPISDLHLQSGDINDPFEKGDIKYIWTISLIAFFVLSLACINFINLSTAKSANRAKEVGLRKTIGSTKGNLVRQFLTESILFSLFSFVLALVLVLLALPQFNQLTEKSITLPWNTLWFIPILFSASLALGVIAGLYPAFYLSRFTPIKVIKGSVSQGSKNSQLRNIMVVFQFVASIILIIATLVVNDQLKFILTKDLGFEKEKVILLQNTDLLGNSAKTFRTELAKSPMIESISFGGYLPISGTKRNGNMWWNDGRTKIDDGVVGQNWRVDQHYLETLGIELISGRNFSIDLKTDSMAIVINESMAESLGFSEDPIGKRITSYINNSVVYTVIGVVKDFHFEAMHNPIAPLALRLRNDQSTSAIRVKADQMNEVIDLIQNTWDKTAPNQPFIYEFLDQRFSSMYSEIEKNKRILTVFAILAIIIACLGLLGLSIFMIQQKNKEICVRIALGAKPLQILGLLGTSFMKPIVLSFFIALPVAWYMMGRWLNDFAYNVGLNFGPFFQAGFAAILIALITIGFQSIKASNTNPAIGLKDE